MTKKKIIPSSELLLQSIVEGILNVKGEDIVSIDLRKIPHAIADYYVVCHGNSSTQVDAIRRFVEDQTEKDFHESPWHIEGRANAEWVLMDYGDIVVHIFLKEMRAQYALEELWGDGIVEKMSSRA